MADKTTYFGLRVIQERFVSGAEIKKLPFYEFWLASSRGSTFTRDPVSGDDLIYLDDWEGFSRLFIETGRHRMMDL